MTISAFTKHYGRLLALDFPGAALTPGGVCAVIGANGSGKTTLARCAAGLLAADGGTPVRDTGLSCGYLPQQAYPFHMTVLRNVLLGTAGPGARERADALLARLEIDRLARQKAHRLSGGETARMALARLLMRRYALLILDEPTAAMDVRATLLAEALLRDYVQETGCTLLWVTHSLAQARRTADSVLFLQEGHLAESGPAQRLLTAPESPALKQFLDFSTL